MSRLLNRISAVMLTSTVVCAVLLMGGCANLYKAPPFNSDEIAQFWGVGEEADKALLEEAILTITNRYIDGEGVSSVFKEGRTKLKSKAGVTLGKAQIVVDVELIDPPSQQERVKPVFASLAPEVQRELISTCRCGNDTNNIKNVLNILTDQKKSGLRDYYNPEYSFRISSDIVTGNPYDRFDEIVTLVILDGSSTTNVDITKIASIAESELTVNFGKLEREESQRLKLMASAGVDSFPVPVGGAAKASLSGEYERTFNEKLTRELSEKILTTSSFPLNHKDLSKDGLWIIQRGHKDHKLCHTLAQKVGFSVVPKIRTRATPLWGFEGEGDKQKLCVNKWVRPIVGELGVHVFSIGTVREIDKESKYNIFNEEHTPEEGDDSVSKYIVTSYQHLRLPYPSKEKYTVEYSKDNNEVDIFNISTPGPLGYDIPAQFETYEDASLFASKVAKVTWKEEKSNEYSAEIMGATVKVEGVSAKLRYINVSSETINLSR